MKKTNSWKYVTACIVVLLLTCPFSAIAQQAGDTEWWVPSNQVFRPEELDQMLAPIALYPDVLLAQVLAAATYPNGIVAADSLVRDNPRVNIQTLINVAMDMDWSPSVKAMLQFPDVLAMMDQHLDWTAKLGDAFLTQQRDMMDSIQRLRQMAYQQGRLMNTREMVVMFDAQTRTIVIGSANPDMVYVPDYDPAVIYGTWWYPDYPPYRYSYHGHSASSVVSFLAGILVGSERGWGGWDFDWHHHRSDVQVGNYNNFVSRSYRSPERFQIGSASGPTVAYDTQFRRNAGYRDYTTAQRFGGRQVSDQTTTGPRASGSRGSEQVQARPMAPTVEPPRVNTEKPQASKTKLKGNKEPRPTMGPSPGAADVSAEKPQVPKAKLKVSAEPRPAVSPSVTGAGRSMEDINAFSGVGSGASVRAASFRGQSSLKNPKASEVSQAAHTAKSEGLKGQDAAGKVHEAVDAKKADKDVPQAEVRKKGKDAKENQQ